MGCGGGSRRDDYYDEPRERPRKATSESSDEALRILGVRLAKGEITKQEYEDLKQTLEKDQQVVAREEPRSRAAEDHDDRYNDRPRRRGWLDSLGRGGC